MHYVRTSHSKVGYRLIIRNVCSCVGLHRMQFAIQTFNYERELLIMETKSKVQSLLNTSLNFLLWLITQIQDHIPEIIKIIDKISSLCAEGNSAAMEALKSLYALLLHLECIRT